MAAQEKNQQVYCIYLPPCSKSFFKLLALRHTSVGFVIQLIASHIQALPSLMMFLWVGAVAHSKNCYTERKHSVSVEPRI